MAVSSLMTLDFDAGTLRPTIVAGPAAEVGVVPEG
jgi:hypothetical protein